MREAISYLTSAALHGAGLALLLWLPGMHVEFTGMPYGGPPPGWIQPPNLDAQGELIEFMETPPPEVAFESGSAEFALLDEAVLDAMAVEVAARQQPMVTPVKQPEPTELSAAQSETRPLRAEIRPQQPTERELLAESLQSAATYRPTVPPPLPESTPVEKTSKPTEKTVETTATQEPSAPSQPAAQVSKAQQTTAPRKTEPKKELAQEPVKKVKPMEEKPRSDKESRTSEASSESIAPGEKASPGVDEYPRIEAGNGPPEYPEAALLAGHQGTTTLLVHVNDRGIPESIRIATSSGFVALDEAARAAVFKWKFRPAMRGGKAVAFPVRVPVRFRIEQ